MKLMKLMVGIGALALGIATAASSYGFKLTSSVWVGGTELKAGDYKVEIQGDKAVFKGHKSAIEVPATIGKSNQKYTFTSLVSEDSKLLEIDLGGTSDKILFGPGAPIAGSK
jgi:hypothetical protein